MTPETLAAARRLLDFCATRYNPGTDEEIVARALLAATETRAVVVEECARIFEARALIHAPQALWMGPQRQRYEGIRPSGVEASPMNGPSIAYDREIANAAEVRALAAQPTPTHPVGAISAWNYDMKTAPMDGRHFIVLCRRMDETPIAWQPYTLAAQPAPPAQEKGDE